MGKFPDENELNPKNRWANQVPLTYTFILRKIIQNELKDLTTRIIMPSVFTKGGKKQK